MPDDNVQPEPIHRPLTEEERRLLTWLVEHGHPDTAGYLPQIPAVMVAGRCGCGCPTLDLAVAGKQADIRSVSTVIAHFCGRTPDGVMVGVMLHVREGLLSELEVYRLDTATVFSLPCPENLEPFGPDADT